MVFLTSEAIVSTNRETNEKSINQYTFQTVAGQGTFSTATWAIDRTGRWYAVKVFSRSVLERRYVAHFDEHGGRQICLKQKIDEELRILQCLEHESIVSLEEIIDDPEEERLYAVFEGLIGGQLMTWHGRSEAYTALSEPAAVARHWGETVRNDPTFTWSHPTEVMVFNEVVARHFFRQVLAGIIYLHELGFIHKDVKPDNIFLTLPVPVADARFAQVMNLSAWPSQVWRSAAPDVPVDPAMLSQFGLSCKLGDFNTAMAGVQPDCLVFDAEGTQQFTPPECFSKQGGVKGKPRDAWSLGVLLFTMLFGHCPFWAEAAIQLQLQIIEEDVIVPRGGASALAEDLIRLFLRKEPQERIVPATALDHGWMAALP